jgi:hypothetical protein
LSKFLKEEIFGYLSNFLPLEQVRVFVRENKYTIGIKMTKILINERTILPPQSGLFLPKVVLHRAFPEDPGCQPLLDILEA